MTISMDPFNTSPRDSVGRMVVKAKSGIEFHFHGETHIHVHAPGTAGGKDEPQEIPEIPAGPGVLAPLASTQALPATHPNNLPHRPAKIQWTMPERFPEAVERARQLAAEDEEDSIEEGSREDDAADDGDLHRRRWWMLRRQPVDAG